MSLSGSSQPSEEEAGTSQFKCNYPSCERTFASIYLAVNHAMHDH